MRCNATRRPPLSHTAALTLMLSSRALANAPARMRLASSNVRLIDFLPWSHGELRTDYSEIGTDGSAGMSPFPPRGAAEGRESFMGSGLAATRRPGKHARGDD